MNVIEVTKEGEEAALHNLTPQILKLKAVLSPGLSAETPEFLTTLEGHIIHMA